MNNGRYYPVVIKFIAFVLAFILCALLLNYLFEKYSGISQPVVRQSIQLPTIIIDPGHGGIDGGAVGIDGSLEKDLNLEISLILRDLFAQSNIETVITRDEDVMLTSDSVPSGRRKLADIRGRIEVCENYENPLLLSIHMNSYVSSKYSGLVSYYSSNNEAGIVLSDLIMDNTKLYLQPQNKRVSKPGGSAIYLLDNVTCPAVLVECGFISNAKEAKMLSDDTYRHSLASVLYCSVMQYINSGTEKTSLSAE